MTFKDAIGEQEWDRIEIRLKLPDNMKSDMKDADNTILAGICQFKGGRFISLDGDIYYPSQEILSYERIDPERTTTGKPLLVVTMAW